MKLVLAHNLLHLLEDPQAAISAVYKGLKRGGVFITSTACIGDMSWYFRIIAPIGHYMGLIPFVAVFTQTQLMNRFIDAGFVIDYEWLPRKNAAVFVIAKKP